MLMKIFGAIDFISGLILIFGAGTKFPTGFLITFGIILLVKSLLGLLKDFGSWIDFLVGISFIILIFFEIPSIIGIILGILILQKGIFSFL